MGWFVLAVVVWAGCGPAIRFTAPGAHDVRREFVLPGDMDLDGAYKAVVSVYARLMVSVEESQTKDGKGFRLINGKLVNMSAVDGLNYADCGGRQVREDILGTAFSAPVSVAAHTMAFNVLLLRAADGVVLRIETSFSAREGRGCSSRGSFEEMFYGAVLNELGTL